jgi:hypothetical protein
MLRDKHVKMEPGLRPVSYRRVGNVSHAFQRWRIWPLPVEKCSGGCAPRSKLPIYGLCRKLTYRPY